MKDRTSMEEESMDKNLTERLIKLNQALEFDPSTELSLSNQLDDKTHYDIIRFVFTLRCYITSYTHKLDKEYLNLCLSRLCDLYVDLMLFLFNEKSMFNSRKAKLKRFNKIIQNKNFSDYIDKEILKSLNDVKYIYNNPFLELDTLSCIRVMNDMVMILYAYLGRYHSRYKIEFNSIYKACTTLNEVIRLKNLH